MLCIYFVTKLLGKHRQCTVRGGGTLDVQALSSGRHLLHQRVQHVAGTLNDYLTAVADFNRTVSWHCVPLLICWQQALDLHVDVHCD